MQNGSKKKRNKSKTDWLEHGLRVFEKDERKSAAIFRTVGFVIRQVMRNVRFGVQKTVNDAFDKEKKNKRKEFAVLFQV